MKDKLKQFLKENSYAAAVYSCIALVVILAAGVAFYDSLSITKPEGEISENYAPDEPYEAPVSLSKDKSYVEEKKEKSTEGETQKTAEETKKPEAVTTPPAKEQPTKTATADNLFSFDENTQDMLMPTAGQIVMDYSPDLAVYDPTLEQYRTNDTICIAADPGSNVVAAADGVVYDAGFNETDGHYIVVDHGNGWMSTYSQLGENMPAAVGDIVNAGEVIAYVGEPTVFGSALGSHLEFYLTHNEEPEDPKLLFNSEE